MAQFRNTASGNLGGLNSTVELAWRHFDNGGVGAQLTGTLSGTVVIEGTIDGVNWDVLAFIDCSTGDVVAGATGITANGIYRTEAVGFLKVQARCSAYTSGVGTMTLVCLAN